jgi:hypothetical protein
LDSSFGSSLIQSNSRSELTSIDDNPDSGSSSTDDDNSQSFSFATTCNTFKTFVVAVFIIIHTSVNLKGKPRLNLLIQGPAL